MKILFYTNWNSFQYVLSRIKVSSRILNVYFWEKYEAEIWNFEY